VLWPRPPSGEEGDFNLPHASARVARVSVPVSFSPHDGRRFILELDRRLERLDRAILAADWDLYSGRSVRGAAEWQLRRSSLLSDERILGWVRPALSRSWPEDLRRRLELLERILVDTRVEQHREVVRRRAELTRRVVEFRPTWEGRRVNRAKVSHALANDPNPARRRRAYYALEPLYRALEDPVQELIQVRNERARAAGHRSFAEMRLGFEGFTSQRLDELATAAAQAASPSARQLRERAAAIAGVSGWHPWDFSYALNRLAPLADRWFPRSSMMPTILRAVDRWGFRTAQMRFRVVFHDLPAGGLTLAPDPPRDVRILVHPRGGWRCYLILFHEVGHAVHSSLIRAPPHLLRWHENIPGFGGLHEGIAGFFEEIPRDPGWLAAQAHLDLPLAESISRMRWTQEVLLTAWNVAWSRTEQLLYRRPDHDPMGEVHRLERRLFAFDEYEPLSFVDSFWIDTPVYAQNYLFASLFSAQLARFVRERFGGPLWPNSKVGPWLRREWMAPGSRFDWVPRVREVTGDSFGAAAFAAAARSE